MLTRRNCRLTSLLAFTFLALMQTSWAQDAASPQLHEPIKTEDKNETAAVKSEHIRLDSWIAYRLAKNPWLDKIAEADPRIVEAITEHSGPAKVLAQHRHLDKIAEADHYLCRRLTRWEGATQKLCRNPYVDRVVALDPEGIYFAINRKPEYARVLVRQNIFNNLAINEPDVVRNMQKHMK